MTAVYDVLVLGSGAAGLSVALRVLEVKPDARVAVLAKAELTEGSTMYAQGGIAAVLDTGDSFASHIADTLDAGAGLCDQETVRFVVEHAKDGIAWLIDRGVTFDKEGSAYHLTREGGHSHRRIIHAADATGRAVQTTLTEVVRGEGGRLLRPDGTRFMDDYDPRGELAPRDIVARAIDDVMKRLGCECVYLDISHRPAEFVTAHFPNIHATCLSYGIDITKQPIPVVPAAHFTCGGVLTDHAGRTDVEGLYAVGEVACTGLHGANRLASNSLLECLVFGAAAAKDIAVRLPEVPEPSEVAPWDESWVTNSDEEVVVAHNWDEIRRFMWDYVGIVRSTKRLERAKHRVKLLLGEIDEYYGSFRVTDDLIELRNIAMVAELIIRSALMRKESRGLHYTIDFPKPDEIAPAQNTILVPKNFTARWVE